MRCGIGTSRAPTSISSIHSDMRISHRNQGDEHGACVTPFLSFCAVGNALAKQIAHNLNDQHLITSMSFHQHFCDAVLSSVYFDVEEKFSEPLVQTEFNGTEEDFEVACANATARRGIREV
jgi:hypothetical protein